jgi:uncharacterized membrane protein (DUF485 family)
MHGNSPDRFTEDQARAYLEKIRRNSCYRTLRSVINIVTILCVVLLILYVVGLLVVAAQAPLEGGVSTILISYAIGAVLLGGVIIFAARQAAVLFIDLVDAQIEKNARD